MKIVKCKWFPPSGYKAMALWPFIFVRKGMAWAFDEKTERHETIHCEQQKDMLFLGFVITLILFVIGCGWWSLLALPIFLYWYGIEWLIRLIIYRNATTAYKNLCFEREAYANQDNIIYLEDRQPFAHFKYLKNKL